jgi:hypothetical protein
VKPFQWAELLCLLFDVKLIVLEFEREGNYLDAKSLRASLFRIEIQESRLRGTLVAAPGEANIAAMLRNYPAHKVVIGSCWPLQTSRLCSLLQN